MQNNKGIFCLEGFWFGDHRSKDTVRPILDLVSSCGNVPYLYHRCNTIEEFKFSISRWKLQSFRKKYPILYLGFHGESNLIEVGSTKFTLPELQELLGDKCEGTIIHFGSCSTLDIDRRLLRKFMAATKTLAIMGYKDEVDWMKSASFEILLLEHLNNNKFDSRGMKEFETAIKKDCKRQIKELEFRLILNDNWHFARTRKKKSSAPVA